MEKPVLDKLPEDFVPRQQWPEYDLLVTAPSFLNPELVGENPKGVRWGLWPFYLEEYYSDKEPDLSLSKPGYPSKRIALWHRLTRTDIPRGWYEIREHRSQMDGLAFISKEEGYFNAWSRFARRNQRMWHASFLNSEYKIEKAPYPEFRDAYKKSRAAKRIGNGPVDQLGRAINGPQRNHVDMWCARSVEAGDFVAGISTITSETCKGSYLSCAFLHANLGNRTIMTGLIDNWFSISQNRGVKYIHMSNFWCPGKPDSWKGFSVFKAKFVNCYLLYQPTLFRLA